MTTDPPSQPDEEPEDDVIESPATDSPDSPAEEPMPGEPIGPLMGQDLNQWQPPRGPLTKFTAWAILIFIALSVAATIALLVVSFVHKT